MGCACQRNEADPGSPSAAGELRLPLLEECGHALRAILGLEAAAEPVGLPPQAFFESINWHRTALHELGHATGHASRLARDFSGSFGTKKYAFEELVAEMNAAFCCASLGIVPTVRHADYIGSWLEILREDNRAIVRTASAASKAADYLLAFRPDIDRPGKVSDASDQLRRPDDQRGLMANTGAGLARSGHGGTSLASLAAT